ncbi:MAG: NUDIX domain-containing protein [Phycisphaerales bacterium]|jgi:8-oxo-dGTP pyrophosphatase MutT (NUDIX family)
MPAIKSDLIHAYLFRIHDGSIEILQFRRTEHPLLGTWQPVMGHLHPGESAMQAAARETLEETGLDIRSTHCRAWYALEQIHPFFLPQADAVILSPSFAVEVTHEFIPRLCPEHDRFRWIPESSIDDCFMWPGQRLSAREIRSLIVPGVLRALDR